MSPKTVLITGANRGIGLEFVRKYLNKGVTHVFATARKPSDAKELNELAAAHKNLHVLQLNTTDYARYPALFDEVKQKIGNDGLDLLINNAGIGNADSLDTVTPEGMAETFAVNAMGPLFCTKAALPLLRASAKANGKAQVVNISSGLGSIEMNTSSYRLQYSYKVSKAALSMVAKSLSVDLKGENIQIFNIAPGWVKTDMGTSAAELTTDESVGAMVATIDKLPADLNGHLINRFGERLPW